MKAMSTGGMKDDPQGGPWVRRGGGPGFGRVLAAGWLTHGGMGGWRDLGHRAVALVTGGRGRYCDEAGGEAEVEAGSLILSFPGLRHFYHPDPGTRWTEYFLVFDSPVFDLWESCGLFCRSRPVIRVDGGDYWARRFEAVLAPSGRPGMLPAALELCRLQAVLAELLGSAGGAGAGQADPEWAMQARAVLGEDGAWEIPIEVVARRFGMAPAAFRRKFLRVVGESPVRYRSARRIDRACELMQSTGLLDKEIAERLGFCDEFYFSRRFREITGKSPREFRAILPGTMASRHQASLSGQTGVADRLE